MDDTVREEDVRLHDARRRVGRTVGDILSGAVEREPEFLPSSGGQVGELRRIDRCSVQNLVGEVTASAMKPNGRKARRTYMVVHEVLQLRAVEPL